jgi:hypothetical protein
MRERAVARNQMRKVEVVIASDGMTRLGDTCLDRGEVEIVACFALGGAG